jgi:hypothetical protein
MRWDDTRHIDSDDTIRPGWSGDQAHPHTYVPWDDPNDPAWFSAILVLVLVAVAVLAITMS